MKKVCLKAVNFYHIQLKGLNLLKKWTLLFYNNFNSILPAIPEKKRFWQTHGK